MRISNEQLVTGLAKHGYVREAVTLASGEEAEDYLDCRQVWSQDPVLLNVAAFHLLQELLPSVEAVGGLTLGADPLAYAVALRSVQQGRAQPISPFVVRKEPKRHGRQNVIEGCPPVGTQVCVLDDVVTTGGSVAQAIYQCEQAGLHVVQVLSLVERVPGTLWKYFGLTNPGILSCRSLLTMYDIRTASEALTQ